MSASDKADFSLEQIHLNKEWRFVSANIRYKRLRRPISTAKITFARIKYRLLGRPTLASTKLFFGEKMIVELPKPEIFYTKNGCPNDYSLSSMNNMKSLRTARQKSC